MVGWLTHQAEAAEPLQHLRHVSSANSRGSRPALTLGACHSGDFLHVADWDQFLAVARGSEPGTRTSETRDLDRDLTERPGYTGTAHALLRSGVPAVVAMRYAVRDDYARELALEFYRRLLADPTPKTVAAALTGARNALLDDKKHDQGRFNASDHATPVLYGEADPGLVPPTGRSPAPRRDPRRHTIGELTLATHPHFVGRTWELAGLGADVIGTRAGAHTKPVAVITGLGGMGKTALIAEALALWATRFDWVLLYQAKPNPLVFDATLQNIHLQLSGEAKRYHDHIKAWPADAIHRVATPEFQGPARLDRLTSNLIRALQDEPILLVLDNFETNLKAEPAPGTSPPAWPCQDPAWERCLARLADELVGAPSRVLITSRRSLAALATPASHSVVLGPLPPGEAALFLKDHPALGRMVFSPDAEEQALARRLLTASRFHPLLMDRLARLATSQAMRPQFMAALEALETTEGFSALPALFGTSPDDALERSYLEDALVTSLDVLLGHIDPDARRLLWMIATANDPVALGMLRSVWGGESLEHQRLRQIQRMLDEPEVPPELQARLPELRALLDALPPAPPVPPGLAPLVGSLVAVGLAIEGRTGPEDDNPDYTCHELVRERIRAWADRHPHDRGGWTENALRLAFAERLQALFIHIQHKDLAHALHAGSRAIVYYVQAGAYDHLGHLAGTVITSLRDPRLLTALLPHLQSAAQGAPEGESRWSCLGHLADALRLAGQPDSSLPFYAEAVDQVRAVAEAHGNDAQRAWSDLAWLTGNWACALHALGQLDAARQRHREAADAHKQAGDPAIDPLGNELETLRLEIDEGRAEAVLPEVESLLAQVEAWWQQHRAGQPVPEAPNAEMLARTLSGALDVARGAYVVQQDWESALRCCDASLALKRTLGRQPEDIARERVNRANVLIGLNRFGEARTELEACLRVFQNDSANSATVLSSIAHLFNKQGDAHHAAVQERRALALREILPDPDARAISHGNLGNYLDDLGTPQGRAEAPAHRLAALLYRLVAGLGGDLQISLHNYAVEFHRGSVAGTTLSIPRVSELLADPAFHPLAEWLRLRQVDLPALQAGVDRCLNEAQSLAGQ